MEESVGIYFERIIAGFFILAKTNPFFQKRNSFEKNN